MIMDDVKILVMRLKNEMDQEQKTVQKFAAGLAALDGWNAHYHFGQDGDSAMAAAASTYVRGRLIHHIEVLMKQEKPATHIALTVLKGLEDEITQHAVRIANHSSSQVTNLNQQHFLAALARVSNTVRYHFDSVKETA